MNTASVVGIPWGGGDTQILPYVRICLDFLHSHVMGMQKLWAHAIVPSLTSVPPGETFINYLFPWFLLLFAFKIQPTPHFNWMRFLFYQVMDHTDNLIQLNNDLTNVQTNIEEIEDRTTAAQTNIILLESEIEVLDTRASDIEQILFGKKHQSA